MCVLSILGGGRFYEDRDTTEATFLVLTGGYSRLWHIGLSYRYRPIGLCSMVGRYDHPMPESTISPQSGTKNLATVLNCLCKNQVRIQRTPSVNKNHCPPPKTSPPLMSSADCHAHRPILFNFGNCLHTPTPQPNSMPAYLGRTTERPTWRWRRRRCLTGWSGRTCCIFWPPPSCLLALAVGI